MSTYPTYEVTDIDCTCEATIVRAIDILEGKRVKIQSDIGVLQSKLNFVRCLAQEPTPEEKEKMRALNRSTVVKTSSIEPAPEVYTSPKVLLPLRLPDSIPIAH